MKKGWAKLAVLTTGVVALALTAAVADRYLDRRMRGVSLTGIVEATQVEVSPQIPGRILELRAREGQRVERGEILVVLKTGEATAEVAQAEAALRAAEAQLREAQTGPRSDELRDAEARVSRAQARLAELRVPARPDEIEQARAALRNTMVAREWTQRELNRARELFAKEIIPASEVERARQAYESALPNELAARERLALLEAGSREQALPAARTELSAARERRDALRSGPRPHDLAATRARVAEARAALERVRVQPAETRIMSPLAGLVLRKNVEVGETVRAGVSVLTLTDPRGVWVRAYGSETEVGRIKLGQAATITFDVFPGRRFAGRVTEIAANAGPPKPVQTRRDNVNGGSRVKIAIDDAEGLLMPGLPADVHIHP